MYIILLLNIADGSGATGTESAANAVPLSPCRAVPASKLNVEEFDCILCRRLLFESVTTPCGHTFCRLCLDRALDHSAHCPLCKTSLEEVLTMTHCLVLNAAATLIDFLIVSESY